MRTLPFVFFGVILLGCTQMPDDPEVLKDEALATRLSGQELRVNPPQGTAPADLVLIARLETDQIAYMSAEKSGVPVRAFTDTERWEVRGQALCIYDEPGPDEDDCIKVDWISGNNFQLSEVKSDGTRETSRGTLEPL